MSEWVKIDTFDRYEINKTGEVRSLITNKILKPVITCNSPYARVFLRLNGKTHSKYLHRLLALHFIPNPENLPVVDHINQDKTDNRIENLRWSSISDNGLNRNVSNISASLSNELEYFTFQKMIKGEVYRKTFTTLEQAIKHRDDFLQVLRQS